METARQLASKPGIEKIFMGCRSSAKAMAAIKELESQTGASIFEFERTD